MHHVTYHRTCIARNNAKPTLAECVACVASMREAQREGEGGDCVLKAKAHEASARLFEVWARASVQGAARWPWTIIADALTQSNGAFARCFVGSREV